MTEYFEGQRVTVKGEGPGTVTGLERMGEKLIGVVVRIDSDGVEVNADPRQVEEELGPEHRHESARGGYYHRHFDGTPVDGLLAEPEEGYFDPDSAPWGHFQED